MSPVSTRICVPNLVAVRRLCRKKRGGGVQTDRQTKKTAALYSRRHGDLLYCGNCQLNLFKTRHTMKRNRHPLNFQKKRWVTSVAIVISTLSTMSEQERNGQGRHDVGKSVHVRQAIMQLDAYHMRRGFVQKTANKVVYNDGKRLLFAYPFLDVAALMDLLYISRSSAVRPTLHSQVHCPPQCDHIILTIALVFLCFFGIVLFLLVLISSMVGFVYMSEITYFVFLIKFPI